jgi:hypothetical protein
MHHPWKSIIHDYVHTRNQMEINYSLEPLFPQISDQSYMAMQQKRLGQLKQWHKTREIIPRRSQTRIKIMRVQQNADEYIIDLGFKLQFYYDFRNKEHCEQRGERERITLSEQNGLWIISKIEVLLQEKLSSPITESTQTTVEQTKSIPYLNEQIFARPESSGRRVKYDRIKVQQYADTWWDQANPDYIHFDVDCTNYVSQCLYAGNAPMNYTGKREKGWWYKGQSNQEQWSFSWSVSHSLQWHLSSSTSGLRADPVKSAAELALGDVIIYDWDGNGKYQHSVIVAAMDADGMPLVNAHTSNSRHRYWDYRDSYAWSEKTKYRFFHIADTF